MHTYQTVPARPEPIDRAPLLSKLYRDQDGDLLMYVDPESDEPWLTINYSGVSRVSANYPREPLEELSAEEMESVLQERVEG